ncbi:hypothetical protein WA026_014361 [Henosepilachna vigintioctopunctata]|uniref:Uncharacterized protein n=1 Tax=Henosepilachna vigintioctopunctata TaxID=420089 RepID=A0AAW1UED3_9CUCU
MNLIFFLLLAFFSLSEVNGKKKLRICLPIKENNENTNSIQEEKLLGEAFREISSLVLPSAPQDKKIDFALDNDVIRAKGYVKNAGLVNTELNISVCTGLIPIPTSIILNEIAIHADEYYLNGTVADIFYIDGNGTLDITIRGLSVHLKDFRLDWPLTCFTFNIDVKLQEWEVTLPLRTVASMSSSFGGQGMKQCNCKKNKNGQCVSNKCNCKKAYVLCNSRCHSSLTCNNK